MTFEERDKFIGKSLNAEQVKKLKEAAALLPEGLYYEVSDDNNHITLKDETGAVACMTFENEMISGWCESNRKFIDRACIAVWGRMPPWQD
jgi:hypothetical protein